MQLNLVCAGMVPKQCKPSTSGPGPPQNPQASTCELAAEDAVTEQLVDGYDAAISFAVLWHCPISQAAAARVRASSCRWRLALETRAPNLPSSEATPEPVAQATAPQKVTAPEQRGSQPDVRPIERGHAIAGQHPQQRQQGLEDSSYSEQDALHEPGMHATATRDGGWQLGVSLPSLAARLPVEMHR